MMHGPCDTVYTARQGQVLRQYLSFKHHLFF